jgi:putative glutamine amidotransferase
MSHPHPPVVNRRQPLVLVPACNKMIGHHPFHVAGKKYVDAVRLAGCLPLVVPTATTAEIDELLALADGVLLTGSVSNVHPGHFGEEVRDPSLPLDPGRDAWTLPLIPAALDRGIPLFAICRGLQEANVALGGSLHQAVQEVPARRDHRAKPGADVNVQYGIAHPIAVEPGGVLQRVLGLREFDVNSLHGQGVNRLAPPLRVEATAPDGTIEAFSHPQAPGFNLFVQWHPEWRAAENPVSLKLFQAFGDACREYHDRHSGPLT